MDRKTQAKFDARAKIIKAMAHPTRLFIVDELSRGDRCVGELTKMIEADMSTVSKHLSVLKNAGIIVDEKKGCKIYYKLKCKCVLAFINCVEDVMRSNAKEHLNLIL